MSGLDTASRSGNTYDSTWAMEDGPGIWYAIAIGITALDFIVYLAIVLRTKVEDHLDDHGTYHSVNAKKVKDYTYTMFALGGLNLVYALYSAVFPTQYVSYFVWTRSALSNLFAAWFFNTLGQVCQALQLFFAVNLCIEQVYDENTRDRPKDKDYPRTAKILTALYVFMYIAGAGCALLGLVMQDWQMFLIMVICRMIGCTFALHPTVQLFRHAKMLREKCEHPSGFVDCDSWSAEPMAFVYSLFLLASIVFNAVIEIPSSMDHLQYQRAAEVPTLEFSVGFMEALSQQTYTHGSSVWTPMCCTSYVVALGVSSTLAVFMSAAPRLGTHARGGLMGLIVEDDDSSSMFGKAQEHRRCSSCTLM